MGIRIAIYGGTGTGKTPAAWKTPNVRGLDFEARTAALSLPADRCRILYGQPTSVRDVQKELQTFLDAGCETLVVDSATAFQENFMLTIKGKRPKPDGSLVALETLEGYAEWGDLKTGMKNLFRLLDYIALGGKRLVDADSSADLSEFPNVVCTFWQGAIPDPQAPPPKPGDDQQTIASPMLEGRADQALGHHFDLILYTIQSAPKVYTPDHPKSAEPLVFFRRAGAFIAKDPWSDEGVFPIVKERANVGWILATLKKAGNNWVCFSGEPDEYLKKGGSR